MIYVDLTFKQILIYTATGESDVITPKSVTQSLPDTELTLTIDWRRQDSLDRTDEK